MNPEVKESEYVETSSPNFVAENEAPIVMATPDVTDQKTQTTDQLQQLLQRVYTILAGLPDYLSESLGEYRRPLITLGLIFASVVSVKLTLALLDAVNDIPLLAPTFELIGFGYTAWFIVRFLRTASGRQELAGKVNVVKDEILGKN